MNCLFDSIGTFLNIPGTELRTIICDYMEHHRTLFDDCDQIQLDDAYILKMRNIYTMGGAIEIRACCDKYNIDIIVVNTRDIQKTTDIVFHSKLQADKRIYIQWNGNHYEPIRVDTSL